MQLAWPHPPTACRVKDSFRSDAWNTNRHRSQGKTENLVEMVEQDTDVVDVYVSADGYSWSCHVSLLMSCLTPVITSIVASGHTYNLSPYVFADICAYVDFDFYKSTSSFTSMLIYTHKYILTAHITCVLFE